MLRMLRWIIRAVFIVAVFVPVHVWAAAAVRSTSTYPSTTAANSVITAPSGIQNGDVLLIIFSLNKSGTPPTATPPAGFALVSGTWPPDVSVFNYHLTTYIWYKIASGESGNYTVTHTSADTEAFMYAISGGSSSQPVATINSGSTGPTTTATGLTTAGNDALVVFVSSDFQNTANALSPPTGTTPTFTERLDPGTVAGGLYVADGVLATAGATGNKSITNNSTTTGGEGPWEGFLVAVEASVGGTPETFGFRKRLPQ